MTSHRKDCTCSRQDDWISCCRETARRSARPLDDSKATCMYQHSYPRFEGNHTVIASNETGVDNKKLCCRKEAARCLVSV